MARGVKGQGTVYKLKNPENPNRAYRSRITLDLPDGSAKTITRHGKTKTAAKAALDEAIRKALAFAPAPETVNFNQLATELLSEKKIVRGRKRRTIGNQSSLYTKHIQPLLGHRPIADVGYGELQKVIYDILGSDPPRYRTAEMAQGFMQELYNFARKKYRKQITEGALTLTNLAEDLPKIEAPQQEKNVKLWTELELKRFLAASEKRYKANHNSLSHPLYYTMIAAGLRRGEVLGMRQSSLLQKNDSWLLSVKEQYVYIGGTHYEETPKTQAGVRHVPISDSHAELLKQHIGRCAGIALSNAKWVDHGLLFPSYNGTPIHPRNLYRTRDEICQAEGLPRAKLHELRKIYATMITKELIKQGTFSPKILMTLLGHSSHRVAMEIYSQVVEEDLSKAKLELSFESSNE